MPTSPAAPGAERLPLTGADCFLRAFDAETRRRAAASHLSQLVLRLGPGFDPAELDRVLSDVARAQPILCAPIRRAGGVGAPVYRLDLGRRRPPPRVALHDAPAPSGGAGEPGALPVPELFARRLSERRSGRRGELLRVDAVRYDGGAAGTDLAFTWLHMLLDGAGSEAFVRFLEDCRTGTRAPHDAPAADRAGAPPDLPLPASARARGDLALGWQRRMNALGARSVRSLAGPLRGRRQDLAVDLRVFDEATSRRIRERADARAGFLTPMLAYLAAAIRAHHAVLVRRGTVPESYVVPLPVNLRPRGREGGLFRTRVSMIWFQVDAARAEDPDALLEALKAQRRDAIRDKQVEGGVAAMDFARFAPAALYARMARRPLRGELCSFFFAWTDAFCPDVPRFFGAPVRDGFHAPAVPPSPGSSLVFSLRDARLHVTHVRQRGIADDAELALLHDRLARDLVGAP